MIGRAGERTHELTSGDSEYVPELMHSRLDVLAWHVTMRLRVDRVLAETPAHYRRASRILIAQGRGLLVHRVVDTHIHALLRCTRVEAGLFARYATSALRQALSLGAPFEPARFTPITDLRHLYRTFTYVLRQAARHRAELDPLHDGSLLPDLLGMRCLDGAAMDRVRRALPRLTAGDLAAHLGIDNFADAPILAEHLGDASAAAFGLPNLRGRDTARVLARRAAATAGSALPASDVADALGISTRAVFDLRSETTPPALVRAVVLQAKLRAAYGGVLPKLNELTEPGGGVDLYEG